MGSHDLLLNSATAYISQEWLQLQSPVCAVHLMQPLPNYFGLFMIFELTSGDGQWYCFCACVEVMHCLLFLNIVCCSFVCGSLVLDKTYKATDVCTAPCLQERDTGPCTNYTIYWYYDSSYGDCSRFWYGGCDGNDNRFQSREDCRGRCVSPPGIGKRCNHVTSNLCVYANLFC